MKKNIGIIIVFSLIFITCNNHLVNNPVDPQADNYVGVESIDSDGDGVGTWNDVDDIVLIGPASGEVLTGRTQTLSIYNFNPDLVNRYWLQIATDNNDFDNTIVFEKNDYSSNECIVPAGTLPNNSTYYWRAKAFDGSKWSDGWSGVSSFIVSITIGIPENPFPLDNGSTIQSTPLLNWNDVLDADHYEIQISQESDFNTIVEFYNTISLSQYQLVSDLTSDSVYYWRVRILDPDGIIGNWSEVWSFTVYPIFSKLTTLSISSLRSIRSEDLDDDGDLDFLGASSGGDKIVWWENDGTQTFTMHNVVTSFNGAWDAYPIDIEGDGDLDILGSAYYGNEISWFENDGNEIFVKHIIDSNFDSAETVFAIDLDKDGDIDILAGGSGGLSWWKNDGSENFAKQSITTDATYTIFSMDLNEDGDNDIVSASRGTNEIAWWENDGNETFNKNIIKNIWVNTMDAFVVDLDEDGDYDVIGARGDSSVGDIYWWENDGNENFSEHIITETFIGADDISAADFDGDGDIDILSCSSNSVATSGLVWWENDGNENFNKLMIDETFIGTSIITNDIDEDGDIDIQAADYGDGIILWRNMLIP